MSGLWTLLMLLAAVTPAIAILWHRGRAQSPGRHRAVPGDLAVFRAADLIPGQDAAAVTAQQRMAAAVRRETGR